MKKVLLVFPVALCCLLNACSNHKNPAQQKTNVQQNSIDQQNNVHIGGGVSSFVKDSVAFNKAFGHDLEICNFSFDGKYVGNDPASMGNLANLAKVIAHTKVDDVKLTIITTPDKDSIKMKGLSDQMVAYLKNDSFFGGFKKYKITMGADGQPLQYFNY